MCFVVSLFLSVSLALGVALHSRAHCRCVVIENGIGGQTLNVVARALEGCVARRKAADAAATLKREADSQKAELLAFEAV